MVNRRMSVGRVVLSAIVSLLMVALVIVAAPSIRTAEATVEAAAVVKTERDVTVVPRPSIKRDYIPFGKKRVEQSHQRTNQSGITSRAINRVSVSDRAVVRPLSSTRTERSIS
jgi:hypothetical protein